MSKISIVDLSIHGSTYHKELSEKELNVKGGVVLFIAVQLLRLSPKAY